MTDLRDLRAERPITIVTTTHYLEEAEAHADRVALMGPGRLLAVGTPGELRAAVGRGEATLEDVFVAVQAGHYQVFVVPGVVGQSIVTVALYAGLAIIWERDLGLTQRILVAPGPRSALIAGKALGAAVRVVVQVVLVVAVVAVLGMPVRLSPPVLAGVLAVTVAGAMLFASLSLVIASAVTSREQFLGRPGDRDGYLVGALRRLLLGIGPDRLVLELGVLAAGAAVLTAVAAPTYPRRAL